MNPIHFSFYANTDDSGIAEWSIPGEGSLYKSYFSSFERACEFDTLLTLIYLMGKLSGVRQAQTAVDQLLGAT